MLQFSKYLMVCMGEFIQKKVYYIFRFSQFIQLTLWGSSQPNLLQLYSFQNS